MPIELKRPQTYMVIIKKISNVKKVVKVGLAFSFQKLKTIPVNKHDKKLDIIITEKEII